MVNITRLRISIVTKRLFVLRTMKFIHRLLLTALKKR